MADPWNLTLDQSVFEDWNSDSRIIINGNDVSDIRTLINKLDEETGSTAIACEIEHKLSICLKADLDEKDITSVLQLITIVSQNVISLTNAVCHLIIETCKNVLHQVLALNSSSELKTYFDSLEHCFQKIKCSLDQPSLTKLLEIIEIMYSHCSLKTYGSLTEELFKHSSALLINILPSIDQFSLNSNGPAGTKMLVPVIAIGKFSCKLDAKSMALIWKFVLKTIQQNPDICAELQLGTVVVFLAEEICYFLDMLPQNSNGVSRLTKVAGFLLKVIIGLLEKDTSILENEAQVGSILNLTIQLQKFTPDAVKYELHLSDELVRLLELHISITIHPLLEYLARNRKLLQVLVKASSQCTVENRLYFTRLLGLFITPNYQLMFRESSFGCTSELLQIFLSSVDCAHSEFNRAIQLHGVIHSGLGVYTVPAYELLVTQACSGMAIVTPASITQCVAVLFQSIIQGGFWSYLMASDVLNFLARYGSSHFCLELVQHLFDLCPTIPTYYSRTICLINRLVPLLSQVGRASLLESHRVDKFPDVWAGINWSSFSSEQKIGLERGLIPSTSHSLKASTIHRLRSICCAGNSSVVEERNDLLPCLIKVGSTLFSGIGVPSAKEYTRHIEYLLICILNVLISTAQPSLKEQHLNLMKILKMALDCKAFAPVQLATSLFLSKAGVTGVAMSPQQPAILRVIANLFCEGTACISFLVQISSFKSFELFFKTTTHSQLASSCVREGQDILVKNFISRKATKPLVGDIGAFFIHQNECMRKPFCNTNPFPKLPVETYSLLPSIDSSTVPEFCGSGSLAKRPRLEKDEHLQYLLANLAKVVSDVELLSPLPIWCKEEIRQRIQVINSFLE